MAQAEYCETLNVNREKLYSVITNYQSYPEFVEGCKEVQVKRDPNGALYVTYHVSIMSQDIRYTLEHHENTESGEFEWKLVESNFFKKNVGKWELRSIEPNKTEVRYSIEVEFKIPVPNFVLNRIVKGSLPSMVKSFANRAKK